LTPEGIFFYAFLKNSDLKPLVQPLWKARAIWDSGARIWDTGAKIWDMGAKMWDTGAVALTTGNACRCLEKFKESLERQ
jgi:hypothetical protein